MRSSEAAAVPGGQVAGVVALRAHSTSLDPRSDMPGMQVAGMGAQRALAGDLGRVHLPCALLPGDRPWSFLLTEHTCWLLPLLDPCVHSQNLLYGRGKKGFEHGYKGNLLERAFL